MLVQVRSGRGKDYSLLVEARGFGPVAGSLEGRAQVGVSDGLPGRRHQGIRQVWMRLRDEQSLAIVDQRLVCTALLLVCRPQVQFRSPVVLGYRDGVGEEQFAVYPIAQLPPGGHQQTQKNQAGRDRNCYRTET